MKFFLLLMWITIFCVTPAQSQDMDVLQELRNFHRVSDELLTSGQIFPSHIPALQSEQVELVINLAVADAERNGEEPFAVAAAGISYFNIPVLWTAPNARDLALFFAVMDAREDRKTLVHCFANFRASAFTYLYRVMREGVPEAEASKDLYAVWTEAKFDENPAWRLFIDETLAAHGRADGGAE